MNRRGFVSIFMLLIIGIVLVNAIFIFNVFSLQNHISISSGYKIQSNLLIQDKINRLIYDEENFNKYLKPKIIKNCRGTVSVQAIDFSDDLELKKDITEAIVSFQEINGRKNLVLDLKANFNKMSRSSNSYGTIINEIFEIGENYISEREMGALYGEYYERFDELMGIIEKEIFNYDCSLTSYIKRINTSGKIKIDGGFIRKNNEKNSYDEILSDYKSNRILLNIYRDENTDEANLQLGLKDSDSPIKFRGTIYIEGNIIIEQDLEFDGIIILNNGNLIVNSKNVPNINGMIIQRGGEIIGNINLKGNQNLIYEYGSYLPGFIESNIDVIKKY